MIEQGKIFVDRRDAGFEVGMLLQKKYKDKNVLVLGIPRGGIVIAYEIANILHGELSTVVTKKLPHPLRPELAIGAAAEDGSLYLSSYSREVSNESIRLIVAEQQREIERRIQRFRKGAPLPMMNNRIVIIADDGIATGSTIVPALKLCKSRNPARLVVAAPVSGSSYVADITDLADEVVVAEQPDDFFAVGQVYEDFHHLSDEEVLDLLDEYEQRTRSNL